MTGSPQQIHVFEHPGFNDVHDALRQSRLHGFNYRAEHAKFKTLCEALRRRVPEEQLQLALTRPLDAVADNSALYIFNLTDAGREVLWPALRDEALALGFNAFDDRLGQCHTPAGVWSADGFSPAPAP